MNRVWTREEVMESINRNDVVLYGALKKLYARQVNAEKKRKSSIYKNGKGFNAADAKLLSGISDYLIRNGFLTDKQKFRARERLAKYGGQLVELANAK